VRFELLVPRADMRRRHRRPPCARGLADIGSSTSSWYARSVTVSASRIQPKWPEGPADVALPVARAGCAAQTNERCVGLDEMSERRDHEVLSRHRVEVLTCSA